MTGNHSHGCNGGDTSAAFAYMASAGVPDESCQNYEAVGDGKECTPLNICRTCAPGKGCSPIVEPQLKLWKVEEHGQVFGARNMMAEIAARGPITCTIACPETLENYTGGVFEVSSLRAPCLTELRPRILTPMALSGQDRRRGARPLRRGRRLGR